MGCTCHRCRRSCMSPGTFESRRVRWHHTRLSSLRILFDRSMLPDMGRPWEVRLAAGSAAGSVAGSVTAQGIFGRLGKVTDLGNIGSNAKIYSMLMVVDNCRNPCCRWPRQTGQTGKSSGNPGRCTCCPCYILRCRPLLGCITKVEHVPAMASRGAPTTPCPSACCAVHCGER